jgi:hypothetical protein
MLTQAIWWSSIVLETLLLIRGLQTRLVLRYPFFFGYVSFVLFFEDILSIFVQRWNQHLYTYMFWATEFIGVVIGCGVVFEIYRSGLARYPGTARMARNVLAFVFALAAARALITAANDPQWWLQANTLEIARVLRTVQALAILALVAVLLFYSIPFGRNLRGILLGYGTYVSVLAVCLAFAHPTGRDFVFYALSASFSIALFTWLTHLWSYSENPALELSGNQLEIDYQRAAAATRRRLQAVRGQLARAVRS